jgi:hypothetical protein
MPITNHAPAIGASGFKASSTVEIAMDRHIAAMTVAAVDFAHPVVLVAGNAVVANPRFVADCFMADGRVSAGAAGMSLHLADVPAVIVTTFRPFARILLAYMSAGVMAARTFAHIRCASCMAAGRIATFGS